MRACGLFFTYTQPDKDKLVSSIMNVVQAVEIIKKKFDQVGSPTQVPLLKGESFTATLTADGIIVDNLDAQRFLPWAAFQEAVCILLQNGGRAKRGNAMNGRLGDAELPLDSVEGHIALVVYGKNSGQTVFRRITPVACILIWAGICDGPPSELVLR